MRLVRLAAKSNFSFVTSVRPYGTTHEITGVMGHRIPVNCLLENTLQLVEKTQGFSHNRTKISHTAKKNLTGFMITSRKIVHRRGKVSDEFCAQNQNKFQISYIFFYGNHNF